MKQINLKKYLFNCFWLTLPPTLISLFLMKYLPASFQANLFWNNIPPPISLFENTFRTLVIMLPIFFPLGISTKSQHIGLYIYGIGIVLYLLSYIALIVSPVSYWSQSLIGFTAPASTPLIWFVGIGLIMEKPFFNVPYKRWFYMVLVGLFISFHFTHTLIIYYRYF
jgi:hypothetical protein